MKLTTLAFMLWLRELTTVLTGFGSRDNIAYIVWQNRTEFKKFYKRP